MTCKKGFRPGVDDDNIFKTASNAWQQTTLIIFLVDQGFMFKNLLIALGDFI
ncbi:hypothetical protein [Umezakia ovalisporum]|jgi:hypothetical protein|uniref:hypothetical protein n=1 Tax=Umezakia ovalisporum TaxID=75695 RepID=UPI0039C6BF89